MSTPDTNKFGKRFQSEAEHFYQQFQKLLHMSEPLARLIARQAADDAVHASKIHFYVPATLSNIATLVGGSATCALRVVNVCVTIEAAPEHGIDIEASRFQLSPPMARWVEAVTAALARNDAAEAKAIVAAKPVICMTCKQWEFDGRIVHAQNCHAAAQAKLKTHQAKQPSQKQLEHQKINAAIKSAKLAAKLGPPISAPSPKQSKPHHHSSWPPIVSGGGVETNRRKH